MQNENISSAEMTAYWRSKYPKLSHDLLSKQLSSPQGVEKASQFEAKYNYPLIGRKVSARAGWFLNEAVSLLKTGHYNSCISFGSGFSLLTYYISKQTFHIKNLKFLDVDLEDIISARIKRISSIDNELFESLALGRISILALNLESAYQSGKKFTDFFGVNQDPVFIIEGIIYFLSKECVHWIFDGIQSYKNYAILFDYWPDNAPSISQCFKRSLNTLNDFIPEQTRGLLSSNEISLLCHKSKITQVSLQEVENTFSIKNEENPQLLDQNTFFPVQLVTVTPNKQT